MWPNHQDKDSAIATDKAADLADATTQIAERSDVRAVLIAGNEPNFTVGGDLCVFAGTVREQLPNRLRRMIGSYHLAIERLTCIDAPRGARCVGTALRRQYCRCDRAACAGLWGARPEGPMAATPGFLRVPAHQVIPPLFGYFHGPIMWRIFSRPPAI